MANITIRLEGLSTEQEQKLLQLYTDALGYQEALAENPSLTRGQFAKRQIIRHLLLTAKEQYKNEEGTTARTTAHQNFEAMIETRVKLDNDGG